MQQQTTSTTTSALISSYKNEIIQCFHIFDEERTGTISLHHFKLILRALGFRVTRIEIIQNVLQSNERRGIQMHHASSNGYNNTSYYYNDTHDNANTMDANDDDDDDGIIQKEIDLDTVLDVILNPTSKYNKRNLDTNQIQMERKINFKLLDVENKGYITFANLKQAMQELKSEDGRRYLSDGDDEDELVPFWDDIDDEELRAMIEEFDIDQDGMISEVEFRRIMQY